jgi:hypothetical protein
MTNETVVTSKWTIKNLVVCMFYSKYGIANLYFETEEELAKYCKCTIPQLKIQSSTFKTLFNNKKPSNLDGFTQEVFDEFKEKTFVEFFNEVKVLIKQDEVIRKREFKLLGKTYKKYKKIN